MAIEQTAQSQIVGFDQQSFGKGTLRTNGFADLISGKEPGHRMADYVDDRTTSLLKVNLDTRYEGDRKGSPKKRSMGDIWVHSQGIFNPINVKSGAVGQQGTAQRGFDAKVAGLHFPTMDRYRIICL